MCAFEGLDRSPMEDVSGRIDRLERDRRAPMVLDGRKRERNGYRRVTRCRWLFDHLVGARQQRRPVP